MKVGLHHDLRGAITGGMPSGDVTDPAFRGKLRKCYEMFSPPPTIRCNSTVDTAAFVSPSPPGIKLYAFWSRWTLLTCLDICICCSHRSTPTHATGINTTDTASGTEKPVRAMADPVTDTAIGFGDAVGEWL